MKTKHHVSNKKNKKNNTLKNKTKKFIFPIEAASENFAKTDSLLKARAIYRAKVMYDARKIYGFFVNPRR